MSDSVRPLNRKRIVKKHRTPFKRYQSDRFMRVPTAWRKPRGIDSRLRRRVKGLMKQPKIGYGSDKTTRGKLPNHFKKFRVFNPQDVDLLLMHNRTYAAEIAHSVGSEKRRAIIARAQKLNVKVINANARLHSKDTK